MGVSFYPGYAVKAMSLIRSISFLMVVLLLTACASTPSEPQANIDAAKYSEAMDLVRSGYYDDALIRLRDIQKDTKSPKSRAQVELSIAYTLYKKGEYDLAFKDSERFVEKYPDNEGLAYATYLQGLIRSRQGEQHLSKIMEHMSPGDDYPEELRQAYSHFSEVVKKYPDSAYAKDAIHQSTRLRVQLAEFELYAARAELIKGNYREALRRARYVNEYFSDPAVRKKALEMIVKIYKEAGQEDQARLIQRELDELSISHPVP
jgi:outer membrane protein assembly factor BamD